LLPENRVLPHNPTGFNRGLVTVSPCMISVMENRQYSGSKELITGNKKLMVTKGKG